MARVVNRVILVFLMATFAHADVLGLRFGMTADEVMACKVLRGSNGYWIELAFTKQ